MDTKLDVRFVVTGCTSKDWSSRLPRPTRVPPDIHGVYVWYSGIEVESLEHVGRLPSQYTHQTPGVAMGMKHERSGQ